MVFIPLRLPHGIAMDPHEAVGIDHATHLEDEDQEDATEDGQKDTFT